MKKILDIINIQDKTITCRFNDLESRIFNLDTIIQKDKFLIKIIANNKINNVIVGGCGELCWKDCAEMKDENDNLIITDYDISPEYVYANSISINNASFAEA